MCGCAGRRADRRAGGQGWSSGTAVTCVDELDRVLVCDGSLLHPAPTLTDALAQHAAPSIMHLSSDIVIRIVCMDGCVRHKRGGNGIEMSRRENEANRSNGSALKGADQFLLSWLTAYSHENSSNSVPQKKPLCKKRSAAEWTVRKRFIKTHRTRKLLEMELRIAVAVPVLPWVRPR